MVSVTIHIEGRPITLDLTFDQAKELYKQLEGKLDEFNPTTWC